MPLKRNEVEEWLKRHGFSSRPAYPHIFYRDVTDGSSAPVRLYRYRLTTYGLRRESRLDSGEWIRIRSGYFKNLILTLDDKLQGMSAEGM